MEELIALDQEVFLYLNNLGSETWDWFWLFITNKYASIPLYVVLLILLYKAYGTKTTVITLLLIAGMITCTDQLANLFKHGIQRPRPCQEDFIEYGRYIAVRCGAYGYFSGHAASSSALAIYLGSILQKKYKYAFIGMIVWCLIISYSRIYVGVHYPGDVLTGMLVGGTIGFLFYQLQKVLVKKFA